MYYYYYEDKLHLVQSIAVTIMQMLARSAFRTIPRQGELYATRQYPTSICFLLEKSKNSIVRIFVRRCSAMCGSSSYKKNSSRAVLRRASTSQRHAHGARPSRPVRVAQRTCCCCWRSRPAGLGWGHVEPGSCAHKQPHRVRFAPRGQGGAGMCGAARGGSRRGRGEGRVQICWFTCRAHVRFE